MIQAFKQFAKKVGAPDVIICDTTREQKSAELKNFCNGIGISLRVLEKDRPWANKTEFYIGLIKETVCKDTQTAHSPIPFWDYCVKKELK